jgi:hypothetical protein
MSFGLSETIAGNYPQADGRVQLKALTDAGIIAVAAASNEGSSSGGSSLFTTGESPGSVPGVLSVASVENTAQPGSLLQLDREIDTPMGPKSVVGKSDTFGYINPGFVCLLAKQQMRFKALRTRRVFQSASNCSCLAPLLLFSAEVIH